ncbi:hypothetical protein ABK040_007139 [Willaertia magna]
MSKQLDNQQHLEKEDDISELNEMLSKLNVTDNKDEKQKTKKKYGMKFNGTQPNIKWKSITLEELQLMFPKHYFPLNSTLIENINDEEELNEEYSQLVPQRTNLWNKLREKRITASKFSTVLGFFDTLVVKYLGLSKTFIKKNKNNILNNDNISISSIEYENLFTVPELLDLFNLDDESILLQYLSFVKNDNIDTTARVFMDFGSNHEANGIATILSDFDFCNEYNNNNYTIHETGFYCITKNRFEKVFNKDDLKEFTFEELPLLGASPDGLIKNDKDEIVACIEMKCPTCFVPKYKKKEEEQLNNGDNKTEWMYMKRKPHENVPVYYLPQMIGQMIATNTTECYYCSWTCTLGCNVFKVSFNKEYAIEMLYWLTKGYQHVRNGNRIIENYFILNEESDRYKKFLDWSVDIVKNQCPLVKHIEKSIVYNGKEKERKDLFLD